METLNVNGQAIAYRYSVGLCRTVVFCNSLGSDQSIWDQVIQNLPRGYGVLTYDLPGHGLSCGHAASGIDGLAQDVIELMEALRLSNVLFCGLSIGGMIGQCVAALRPDLLSAAILCNSAAKIGPVERWNKRIRAVRSAGVEGLADTIVNNWFGTAYNDAHPQRLMMHRNMIARTTDHGYEAACLAIRDADLTSVARSISIPVHCIGGSEDKSVPAQSVRGLASLIQDAKVTIFGGVGHMTCLEAPAKLAQLIEEHDRSDEDAEIAGMTVRKRVLGNDYVGHVKKNITELDRAFQSLITKGAWAEVWASPGISSRERSMLTIALLAAQGNFDEIPMHVRATERTGATKRDVAEALQHVAVYSGVPRANQALKIVKKAFLEMETDKNG